MDDEKSDRTLDMFERIMNFDMARRGPRIWPDGMLGRIMEAARTKREAAAMLKASEQDAVALAGRE